LPAAGKVYKGDIVKINTSGYVNTITAPAIGDMSAGIALETVDNTLGGASDKWVRVDTEGVVQLLAYSLNVSDVGTHAIHSTASESTGNEKTVKTGAEGAGTLTVGAIVGVSPDDMTAAASATKEDVYLLCLRQIKAS
jgi:hypothetical protein